MMTRAMSGGVMKAMIKPMPRMVPGTAAPRFDTKSRLSLPENLRRTTRYATTIPSTPAIGVVTADRNVVSRIASMPRSSAMR